MGVWLISAALAGYFSGPLSTLTRVGFAVTGLMALIPAEAFSGAALGDILGVVLGLGLMVQDVLRNRSKREARA
jgi:hypothetical protein